jgi:ribosomal-protein-alanine acetyltransferase
MDTTESPANGTAADAQGNGGSGPTRSPLESPPLQIRRMSLQDLDEVMRIERAVYPFPWSRGNFSDSLRAGHDAWRFDDDSGRMIGYAVLMWAPDEVHLLNLSVDQPFQGRGLGERLLRWLADDAHRRGAPSLLLEVRPSNPVALRLYERVGMQRIGLRRGYYPSTDRRREDAVVMRVALPLATAGASRGSGAGARELHDAE